jgi:hypothetical protein
LTWTLAFTRDSRRERAFTTAQVGILDDVYDTPKAAGAAGAADPAKP